MCSYVHCATTWQQQTARSQYNRLKAAINNIHVALLLPLAQSHKNPLLSNSSFKHGWNWNSRPGQTQYCHLSHWINFLITSFGNGLARNKKRMTGFCSKPHNFNITATLLRSVFRQIRILNFHLFAKFNLFNALLLKKATNDIPNRWKSTSQ